MDHPGFEALGGTRVEFLGGVPPELFAGARIRFGPQKVRVVRRTGRKLMRVSAPVPRGAFGMWDVPAFRVRAGKLYACAVDDVLSVAVVLATLTELVRRNVATHLWGVFTRAEEVGFNGAVEVARSGVIPKSALVVSMEMSQERPWARMGRGPVVRVGDRMTMFDPRAAWFLMDVAQRAGLTAQRALMDGGTCEATAFAGIGYRVGGLCLPLGNYHNIGRDLRPRAEYVSVSDLEGLVALTVLAARKWRGFAPMAAGLRARVLKIRRSAPRRLVR
jgi:endoglucanase